MPKWSHAYSRPVRPLPDPISELKRQAGAELATLFQGWNTFDVAAHVGTDARRITEMKRGQLKRFSLETLIRYLARMRRVVELRITQDFRTNRPASLAAATSLGRPRQPVAPEPHRAPGTPGK